MVKRGANIFKHTQAGDQIYDLIPEIFARNSIANDFFDHVVLPAAVMELGGGEHAMSQLDDLQEQYRKLKVQMKAPVMKFLGLNVWDEIRSQTDIFKPDFRPASMGRTWLRGIVRMPSEHIPLTVKEHIWPPLFKKEATLASGAFTLKSIDSLDGLLAEEAAHNTCINGYEGYCRATDLLQEKDKSPSASSRSFICSLEDADGNKVATAEFKFRPEGVKTAHHTVHISGTNMDLSLTQLEGTKRGEREEDRDIVHPFDPRHQAIEEFMEMVSSGEIALNMQEIESDIEEEKKYRTTSRCKIGFVPHNWHQIDKCFNHYKKDIWTGATGENEQGRLILDGERFIEGSYESEEGTKIPYRDMDAKTWLRATGMMSQIHDALYRSAPEAVTEEVKSRWSREAKEPITSTAPDIPHKGITPSHKVFSPSRDVDGNRRSGAYMGGWD